MAGRFPDFSLRSCGPPPPSSSYSAYLPSLLYPLVTCEVNGKSKLKEPQQMLLCARSHPHSHSGRVGAAGPGVSLPLVGRALWNRVAVSPQFGCPGSSQVWCLHGCHWTPRRRWHRDHRAQCSSGSSAVSKQCERCVPRQSGQPGFPATPEK